MGFQLLSETLFTLTFVEGRVLMPKRRMQGDLRHQGRERKAKNGIPGL